MTNFDSERFRKVAILVDSLDAARADSLLDQMPEIQRAMIRNLVVALENVSDEEREQVIGAFLVPDSIGEGADDSIPKTMSADSNAISSQEEATGAIPNLSNIGDPGGDPGQSIETTSTQSSLDAVERNVGVADSPDPDLSVWFEQSHKKSDNHVSNPPSLQREGGDVSVPQAVVAEDRQVFDRECEVTIGPSISLPSLHRSEDDSVATDSQVESKRPPFSFIRDKDAEQLARCIGFERPQIIARIVASLRPKLAASVVGSLSDDVSRQVLRRLPSMQDSEPEILQELERFVLTRLSQSDSESLADCNSAGLQSLEAILEAADESERSRMIASLMRESPELVPYFERRFNIEGTPFAHREIGNTYVDPVDSVDPSEVEPDALVKPNLRVFPSPVFGSDESGLGVSEFSQPSTSHESMPVGLLSSHRSQTQGPQTQGLQTGGLQTEGPQAESPQTQGPTAHASNWTESYESAEARDETFEITIGLEDTTESFDPDEHSTVVQSIPEDAEQELDELAEAISFDALSKLDNQSFSLLLKHADPQIVLIALAGAHAKLIDKLLRQIPRREAKIVRKRIHEIGPIRVQDIETAQRTLAILAIDLADRGLISEKAIKSILQVA